MFQFSKPRDTGPVSMPAIVGLPSPEDLLFLTEEAQKNWKRAVELSFKTLGGTHVLTLAAQCDMNSGDLLWTLSSVTPTGSHLVWTYSSQDVGLIQDLIKGEFESASTEEELAQHSTETTSSPPGSWQSTPSPAAQAPTHADRAPAHSDRSEVQSYLRSLCQPETGLLPYPAFLYFVDQEYRRLRRGGLSFSVVIFKMRFREADGRISAQPLSHQAISAAALRVGNEMRDIDMLAHFGPFDFAFLLPHTDGNVAEGLVRRFESTLSADPLLPAVSANRLATCFGIANMPGDTDHPQKLIAAAVEALKSATAGPDNIMLYGNIRSG